MSTNSILFGERAAGVYRMSDIYFPHKYTEETTPEAAGKIVPAVGSLVVDDTTGLGNQQYTVVSVDPVTYNPKLIPSTFVIDNTANVDRVLSYGNDIFMLYFSSVTVNVSGSNVNLTRLIVDNKLSLFGSNAATYQLVRTNDDGTESVISRRYAAGDNPTLIPDSFAIPLLETVTNSGIRKCDGCYTEVTDIVEGEDIRCDVYTAAGVLIAQIHLVAKKGHLLNETIETSNPIVNMRIKCSQMDSSGRLYLFHGQNPKELGIYVELEYQNGMVKQIAIDNLRGYCYGLETVSSEILGSEFEIIVKYYLSDSDATGTSIEASSLTSLEKNTRARFISKRATIYVTSLTIDKVSKISPIPIWNSSERCWTLNFLRYRENRKPIFSQNTNIPETPFHTDDTDSIEYVKICSTTNDGTEVSTFNGKLFRQQQTVEIEYKEIVDDHGTVANKTASFIIELRDKSQASNPGDSNFLIKDNANSTVFYGDNTSPHIRPYIKYTPSTGYVIPAEVFDENLNQSAKEVFLENFYYNANPPKRSDEASAPEPTHFRLKQTDGTVLTQLISVNEFTSNLNVALHGNSANYLVNKTVVVEFVRQLEDIITCEYLYGVPVEVRDR